MTEAISLVIWWSLAMLATFGAWFLFVEGVHRFRLWVRGRALSRGSATVTRTRDRVAAPRVARGGAPNSSSRYSHPYRSATRPLPTRAVKGNLRSASTLVTSPPTDSGTSTSEGSPRADFSNYRWPVA